MQWRFPLEPDPLGGPSKHSHNFRIRYCWPSRMLPDQHHLWKGLAHLPMQQSTSDRQGEQRRIQVVPHERVQPVPSAAPLAVKWKEGLVPWRGVPHITVRPVWLLPEVAPPPPAATRGSPRSRRSLVCKSATVIFSQWEYDSSTKAASACLTPRHERQRSWPSPGTR